MLAFGNRPLPIVSNDGDHSTVASHARKSVRPAAPAGGGCSGPNRVPLFRSTGAAAQTNVARLNGVHAVTMFIECLFFFYNLCAINKIRERPPPIHGTGINMIKAASSEGQDTRTESRLIVFITFLFIAAFY